MTEHRAKDESPPVDTRKETTLKFPEPSPIVRPSHTPTRTMFCLRARTSAPRRDAARAPQPVTMTDAPSPTADAPGFRFRSAFRSGKISGGAFSSRSASINVRAHLPPSGMEGMRSDAFDVSLVSSVSCGGSRATSSSLGAAGAIKTTSRATGPSGSARHPASSTSKASNSDDARFRRSSSSARARLLEGVVSFRSAVCCCVHRTKERENARVRRAACLAPPSLFSRKSATRRGFSRESARWATSAITATSSSRGTPRMTSSAVSTAAAAVSSESPGSNAMTVAPTAASPPARAARTRGRLGGARPPLDSFLETLVASAWLPGSARGGDGSAKTGAAYATTSAAEPTTTAPLSVFSSGSSQRTPSVTCVPPPTHGETRRTTGGRSPASRLSAKHAPTDTSASRPRAGAASADAVNARHKSTSARIACRDARARPRRGAVLFVSRPRASRVVGTGVLRAE